MPAWALALTYWLHLLATATWIGSLIAIYVLVFPATKRALKPPDRLAVIEIIQRRLEPITWFSVSLLVFTGLLQMSVNPHYNGFLSTSGQWSLAILSKHVLVAALIAVSAVYTWDVLPAIRRTLLKRDSLGGREAESLERRQTGLLRASLVLAVLILAATAVARAS